MCFHLNIDGVNTMYFNQKTKFKTLTEFILTCGKYIPYFILTETHLKPYHFDAEVAFNDYSIVRADRPVIRKGGVAIYAHKNLVIDKSYSYADQYCQAAIIYNQKHNLLIVGVYRPPPAEESSFTACLNRIQEIIKMHEGTDIQIHGDFNLPFIDWSTREIKCKNRTTSEQNSAKKLIAFMEKNMCVQLVTETTRADKNTLDLVITNNDQAIHSISTEKTQLSDHDFVNCNLLYNFGNSHCKTEPKAKSGLDNLNLNQADWDSIRKDLSSVQWTNILNSDENIESMFRTLETTITNVCAAHAPQHKVNNNSSNNIPKARRSLLRTRRHVNQKINFCKYQKPVNYKEKLDKLLEKKAKIEIELRDSVKAEMERKEAEMITKIKTNPRAFYTYAKKQCKTFCSVGPLSDENNELQSDPTKMCNLLQKQYLKAFSDPESGIKKPSPNGNLNYPSLTDIEFTEDDIIWAINQIPLHSAPGPDKIPSLLLKECKRELAPGLCIF